MRPFVPVALVIAAFSAATAVETMPTPAKVRQAGFHCRSAARYLQSGNVKKAGEYYGKAIKAVRFMPEAHIGLGLIAMSEQKYPQALAEFEMARDGYTSLGEAVFDMEMLRWREAQEEIRSLREQIAALRNEMRRGLGSGSNPLTEQRIRGFEAEIRNLEAIDLPQRASMHEAPGEAYFHLGNAYFRLGRYEDSRQSWETCAERSPKFPLVHNNLAIVHWKAGRFDDARAAIARAEALGMEVNPQLKADLELAAQARAGR